MINDYTKEEILKASKTVKELANKELAKSIAGLVIGVISIGYGVMRGMDFGYLMSKSEVYRKIGVDSLKITD